MWGSNRATALDWWQQWIFLYVYVIVPRSTSAGTKNCQALNSKIIKIGDGSSLKATGVQNIHVYEFNG